MNFHTYDEYNLLKTVMYTLQFYYESVLAIDH